MLSKQTISKIFLIISIVGTLAFVIAFDVPTTWGADTSAIAPKWSLSLTSRCSFPADCETSSPVLADITGDGILDIVVATSNGHVIAIRNNGQLLWNKDMAAAFGMAANTQQINSSPAVADIDNDGRVEIVVGTGSKSQSYCTQGGVIALDHNGNIESGSWPFFSHDDVIPPIGCTDTIFSTPALGDLDKDGDMEIVVGGFDKRIYVLHHNGTLDSNFPIDSEHINRFPSWADLKGKLADTIWGSPSLADINNDGYLDIILGTDEGNFGSSFPGGDPSWSCPYALPSYWTTDYCGGALYVIDRFGNLLPGFPKRIYETIQSSPAVYDINQDGKSEIFVGAGTFYYTLSPSNPTTNFRIYGWDSQGNDLPGWEGGKVTGGSTPASVAVGDIAGDSRKEVIALGMDKKLYAWYANGNPVFNPVTPLNEQGNGNTFNVGFSPILGDYDGDGKMEIFVYTGWAISVIDGNGQQLTATTYPSSAPLYYANSLIQNNPAVGDIDNDGKLELIAQNSTLYAWDLPNAGSKADWPMFRQNAERTGYQALPMLHIAPSSLVTLHETSNWDDVEFTVVLAGSGDETINWTANEDHPDINLSSTSGVLVDTTTLTITVDRSGLVPGVNSLGSVLVTGTINGQNVVNSPATVPVTIYLVDQVHSAYLPSISR
ncbi:MAG: VCBS repeat-containing protein [Ardenticatenaceae bacterium]|nr:VCBS repeat-containing protein [Ardenticatenaceae bacterium]